MACHSMDYSSTTSSYNMEASSEDYSTSSYSSQVSENENSDSFTTSDLEFYNLPNLPSGKITLTCCHCKTRSRSQENSDESATDSCSLISSSSTSLCITAHLRQPECISNLFNGVEEDTSTSSSSVLSEFTFESNVPLDTDERHNEGLVSCTSTGCRYSSSTSSTPKATSSETSHFSVPSYSGSNPLLSDYRHKTANTGLPGLTPIINNTTKVKASASVPSRDKHDQIYPPLLNAFYSWGYDNTIIIKRDAIHKLDELIRKKSLHLLLGFRPAVAELPHKVQTEEKGKKQQEKIHRQVPVEISNLPNDVPLLDPSQIKSLEINVAKRFLERHLAMETGNMHSQPSWELPAKPKRKAQTTVPRIKKVYTPYLSKNQIKDLEINVKQRAVRRHCNISKIAEHAPRMYYQKLHAQCVNKKQAIEPKLEYNQIGNCKTITAHPKTEMANNSKRSCRYSALPLPPSGKHLLKNICLRKQEHVPLLWRNNFQKVAITFSYCFHPHGRRFQSLKDVENPNLKESVFNTQVSSQQQVKQALEVSSKDLYDVDTLPAAIESSDKEASLAKSSVDLPNHKMVGQLKTGQNVLHQVNLNIHHKCLNLLWAQPNVYLYSLKKHIPLPYLPSLIRGKTAQVQVAELATPLLSANNTGWLAGRMRQKKLKQHWELGKLAKKSMQTFLPARAHIASLKNSTDSNKSIFKIFNPPPFISEESEHYLELLVKKHSSQGKHDTSPKRTASLGSVMPPAPPKQEPQSAPQVEMCLGLGTKKDLNHFSSGDQKELPVEDKRINPYSDMSITGAEIDSKLCFVSKKNTQFVETHKNEIPLQKAWGKHPNMSHSCRMPMPFSKCGTTVSSSNQAGTTKVSSSASLARRGWHVTKDVCKEAFGQIDSITANGNLSSQKFLQMDRHFVIKCLEIKAEVLPALVRRSHKAVTLAVKLNLPKTYHPGEGVKNIRPEFLPFIEQDALKCVGMNIKCKYLCSVWKQTQCPTKTWPVPPCSPFQGQVCGSRLDMDASEISSRQRQVQQKIEWKTQSKEIQKCQGGLPRKLQNSQTVCVSPLPTNSQVNTDSMRGILVSTRHLYFISEDRAQQQFNMVLRPLLDESIASQNDDAPTKTDSCAHFENEGSNGTQATDGMLVALPEPTFAGGMLILTQFTRLQKHLIKKYLEVNRDGTPSLVQWSHKAVFRKVKYSLPKLRLPGEGAIIGRAETIVFMEQEALKRIDMNIQMKQQLFNGRPIVPHDGSGESMFSKDLLHCAKTPFKPITPHYCFPSLLQMEIHADLHNIPDCSMQRSNQEWTGSPFGINILSSIQYATSEKTKVKKGKMSGKEPLHPISPPAIQDQPHRLILERGLRRHNPLKPLPDTNNKHQIKAAVDVHLKRRVERLMTSHMLNNKPYPHWLNKLPSTSQYSNVVPSGHALVYNTLMATHATSPKGMLELPAMLNIHLNNKMVEDYFGVPLMVQKSKNHANHAVSPSLGLQEQDVTQIYSHTKKRMESSNLGLQEQEETQIDSHAKKGMEASVSCHEVTPMQCRPASNKSFPPINEKRVDKVLIKNVLEFSLKKIVLCHLLGLQWPGRQEMPSDCNSSHSMCPSNPNSTRKLSNHITQRPVLCPTKRSLKLCTVCSCPIEPAAGSYCSCSANGILKANDPEGIIKMGSTKNMENHLPMRSVTKSNFPYQLRKTREPLSLHLKQKAIMNSCSTPWTVIESRSIYKSKKIQESRDLTRKRRMELKHEQQNEEPKSHDHQEAIKADEELKIYTEKRGSLTKDGCCDLNNVGHYQSLDVKHTHFNIRSPKEVLDKRAFTYKSQMINSLERRPFQPSMCATSCSKRQQCSSHSLHTGKRLHCRSQSSGEQYPKSSSSSRIPKLTSEGQLSRDPIETTMNPEMNTEESVNQVVHKRYELVSSSWHNTTSLRLSPQKHKDGYQREKETTIKLNNTLQKTAIPASSERQPFQSSMCTTYEKTSCSKREQCCSHYSHTGKSSHCYACHPLSSSEQRTLTSSSDRIPKRIPEAELSRDSLEITQYPEINEGEENRVKQLVHKRYELVSYSWHNIPSLRPVSQRHKDEYQSEKVKQYSTLNNTFQKTTKLSSGNKSKVKSRQIPGMQPCACTCGSCSNSELQRQQWCDGTLNFPTAQPSSKSSKNTSGVQKHCFITQPEELSHSHRTTAAHHKKVLKPHRINSIRRRCQKARQACASFKYVKVWKLLISHSYKKIQGWCENITFMQKRQRNTF